MAGSSNYSYDKSNPFFADVEDDDVSDAAFLKNSRPYENSSLQDRREQLLAEKRKIEQRTVQSSIRSIGLLHESEQIGSATAAELHSQREQLENTEKRLDEINASLRTSQKHIQSIKSVFGSIKNYFAGGKNDPPKVLSTPEEKEKTVPKSRSDLSQILESRQGPSADLSDHPVMRLRSESNPSSKEVDAILDKNLEEMGSALSRLKGLGLGLQDEIESQNDLLVRVGQKTEDADWRIKRQNKEMTKILGIK